MPLDDIRALRLKKLEALRKKNIDPYPAVSRRTHLVKDALHSFSSLARSKKEITVAGRIVAVREHGGSVFSDLRDGSGVLQAYFKRDVLGDEFGLFLDTADIGDFVEVSGTLFKTKKLEKTIEVNKWAMLAKTLLPLPDKWHGLQDVEERFRMRYLDLLMNNGIREHFEKRAHILSEIREYMKKNGFLEVETPMLHSIAGGALARPFVTHHNAFDSDFFLRIAPELYLKRLLAGGFEQVFEIGKNFRNEGVDAEHNPEFTELECYAAYWNEQDMMKFVESLVSLLVKKFGADGKISYGGKTITVRAPFHRVSFADLLKRYALIVDFDSETRDSLAVRARQIGIDTEKHEQKGKIADAIYKKICRPYIDQPTFVVDHPLDISPLAKKYPQGNAVRRFQLIAAGMEIMNGFAELNDPLDQRERFKMQEMGREKGEEETHPFDEEFVEMLEYGMPPAAGLGIGIDRLIMLLTDIKNIREAVLFPTLRPK